jgi:hypothetical protein
LATIAQDKYPPNVAVKYLLFRLFADAARLLIALKNRA